MPEQSTKRIPKSLGTETKLLGSYTLTDAAIGLFPGVAIILVAQLVIPDSLRLAGYAVQTLALPVAVFAVAVGTVFVYLTPAYTSSLEWVLAMVQFQATPDHEDHETAPSYTQIEQIHADRDMIERQDGAFVGLVQVSPPPMALATDDQWTAKANAFQDFLNTSVTFPIQIFSTTQPFPVDRYLDRYRDRLHDPDVEANPRLEALIENYIEWYEQDLEARQMTIRDHYVVVCVTPDEVQFEQHSIHEKLGRIPVLGVFVRVLVAPPADEQRAAMFETLTDRLETVERGIRGIDGCRASRVNGVEAARIVGGYWAGKELTYGDLDQALRTRPLVGQT